MVNNSGMKRRILHTSDFHLDVFGDRACECLEAVVDLAIGSKVDLVVIAGDLFDHNRVEDNLVSFVVRQLQRLTMPAIVLPGNHDCLIPGSVFDRVELWSDCANVRIIRAQEGEILDLPVLRVSVWGKSNSSYEDDVRPLAGIPQPPGDGRWHIAMAHGYCVSSMPPFFYSYLITEEEIASSGWDYIALGHIAVFRCVCTEPVKAYYCGSPSVCGTVNLVDLSEETGVQVRRCSL